MESLAGLFIGDFARTAGLALALFVGGASVANLPEVLGQVDAESGQSCAFVAPEAEAEPWIRSELFFGTAKPDGSAVSEAEWHAFLNEEVTPRFPDGLTVLSGDGQWQGENDEIVQERSKIVILLYPREALDESNTEIEDIRTAYEQRFLQESVLRADDDRPVCTSF